MYDRVAPTPELEIFSLLAANLATPLKRQKRLLVTKVIITAGPASDGSTQNAGVLWLGKSDVGVNNGQPLYFGDSLELNAHEVGGLIDLSELFVLGTVATDVLRLVWWPAGDDALAAKTGGAS